MAVFDLRAANAQRAPGAAILMYAVIVASTPELDIAPYQEHIRAADLLIAADGGALPLLRAGIIPHVAIGDMDSIGAAGLAELKTHEVVLRRFPREKDETDLELALLYAAAAGATAIDILGALGGRWDHTLANVALLALPELRERRVRLLADHQTLFLVRDAATLEGQAGDTVSLLPLASAAHGVTTKGLRYPLDNATLSYERARGVSNVLLDPPGHVSLREGLLLVVQ
ncbi:MAG: thiamine diphosphokinase, partial [Chloroflexota bacterium]|nr:thiamine diphosphokinase [Chloroflexota bacterium]